MSFNTNHAPLDFNSDSTAATVADARDLGACPFNGTDAQAVNTGSLLAAIGLSVRQSEKLWPSRPPRAASVIRSEEGLGEGEPGRDRGRPFRFVNPLS